jgi:hypothetical protein
MAARVRLDRKARIGVTASLVALVAVLALFLQKCISSFAADEPIVASSHHDDRLVFIGGHTMVLEHGSVGRQVADWLKLEGADTGSFEIGDQTFSPNSIQLTAGGWSQLVHFAMVMKGHPALSAQIVVSADSVDAADRRLEEMRAKCLRDKIVAQGISGTRVTTVDRVAETVAEPRASGPADRSSHLLVVLSR